MAKPASKRIARATAGIIVTFGFFHGFMLLIAVFPGYWRLPAIFRPVFSPYQELTGTAQRWDMFHTIPRVSFTSAKMEITYPDGRIEERGPVIPGFKATRTPEDIRVAYAIDRILSDESNRAYREAWKLKLAGQVAAEGGTSFQVEVETRFIRTLSYIVKDGVISKPTTERFGSEIDSP